MSVRSIVIPLLKWYSKYSRDLPWRKTNDPYAIWVSEIMLQQTQIKTVIPYWERWMKRFPNISSLANANEDEVIKLWEGLGYYSRVRNMCKAAKAIVECYDGKFPSDLESVLSLPGVGRYTGGAICSIAYNQPEPIVDGSFDIGIILTEQFGLELNPFPRNPEINSDTLSNLITSKKYKQTRNNPFFILKKLK